MTNNNNWRYGYGVVRDLVKYVSNQTLQERVSDIRKQAKALGYKGINTTTDELYHEWLTKGYDTNPDKVRNSIIRHAKGMMFITYTLNAVKAEVMTALYARTPVWILALSEGTELLHFTNVDELFIHMNEQKADYIELMKQREYENSLIELNNELVAVLNTPCTWLGAQYTRLYKLLNEFSSFDEFMTYVSGIIDSIKEEGEWDVSPIESIVLNPKASVYQYVSTKGENKGLRTIGYTEHFGYWENYEVLPANILQEFISLTFYKSVGIKPLKRVMTNGIDYVTDADEDYVFIKDSELHTTPLYVEQN